MFHVRAKIIGRSNGATAAGATAYRAGSRVATAHMAYVAGERLVDPTTQKTYDYRAKGRIDKHGFGVLSREVLAPANAPAWVYDLQKLANAVEAKEKRHDAQLYRELEVSLPRELRLEDWKRALRAFVERTCVREGMVAAIFIHNERASDGGENPHAHIMLTMRDIGPDGFGKKRREWNSAARVTEWREAWAHYANQYLLARGFAARLDHRSHKARGLEVEPDSYVGPAKRQGFDGILVEHRQAERSAAKDRNFARMQENPSWVLDQLSRTQSTFTAADIARFIHRTTARADRDHEFQLIYARVMASPDLQKAASAEMQGPARYTTRTVQAIEGAMLEAAAELAGRASVKARVSDRDLAGLTEEQRIAARALLEAKNLAALHGFAGTGKSHLLAAVTKAYQASGHRVRGAALSAMVARDLGASAGIKTDTIASLTKDMGRRRPFDPLRAGDVLILDEAGMVGSRQMKTILSHAARVGAKVIMVGDSRQLQAIDAGGAFQSLVKRFGAARLSTIHRQRTDWQRQASVDFANARAPQALAAYRAHGHFHQRRDPEEARRGLIDKWHADGAQTASRLILAHTRTEVQALNRLARAKLRAEGKLGPEVTTTISQMEEKDGETVVKSATRQFAQGDRLLFTKNDRDLGVQNGSLGTISAFSKEGKFEVLLDDGRTVSFDPRTYSYLDQGYALTIHKSQGVTVDRTYVLAGEMMDAQMAYVACTRHRDSVDLFYNRQDFPTDAKLMRLLGHDRLKDTTLDYAWRELVDADLPQPPAFVFGPVPTPPTLDYKPRAADLQRDTERDFGLGD
ncbi:MAG: Ti-type conjugative transfer relaxase TraA [Caulobacterales bacterium]